MVQVFYLRLSLVPVLVEALRFEQVFLCGTIKFPMSLSEITFRVLDLASETFVFQLHLAELVLRLGGLVHI